MFRILTIIFAIGIIIFAVQWLREQQRRRDIDEMTPDELVDAVIRRDISILEVPARHREKVQSMLDEIRREIGGD